MISRLRLPTLVTLAPAALAVAWAPAAASVLLPYEEEAQDEEAPPGQDEAPPVDAHALFLANCASCHGETGDGQGWAALDRPARSFQDGGFSFGNTPEALYRTITTGIPGTPMPGSPSLTEEERRALAEYVVTLGPEVTAVDESMTILEVTDRPRVVRGMLPPITEEGVSHPRGLLIGTTGGLTLQYRADDVRLLGIRQGGFVRRTDWTGRGGTALEPLGQVVHLFEGGDPQPTFCRVAEDGSLVPLERHLMLTSIREGDVHLFTRLQLPDGQMLAAVRDVTRALGTAAGAGLVQRYEIESFSQAVELAIRTVVPGEGERIARETLGEGESERLWEVVKRPDGVFECVGMSIEDTLEVSGVTYRVLHLLHADNAETHAVTVWTAEWNDETRALLAEVTW